MLLSRGMFSHGSSSYQAQLINVTRVGAAVEEFMRLHHLQSDGSYDAQYKRAVEELDNAILTMKRQRHASTHQRHGEAKATDFQAEVKAWELVEQTADLNVFPAGELKRIAIAMGVDVTGCLEKSEFVKSIAAKRDNGKEAWLVRKRKRGAEEEIAARQRKKLAELRNEEAKREATRVLKPVQNNLLPPRLLLGRETQICDCFCSGAVSLWRAQGGRKKHWLVLINALC